MEEIGKYKIIRKLARGGMGEVYLAHDPTCDRKVALKKIREDLLKYPVIKKRFLREAKIAAQLSHPSIIPIYSIHETEEELYYTMPYIEGQTLKEILKKTREAERSGEPAPQLGLNIPSLMRIFYTICQGVYYAHSKGFLHRDLKPDNILIGTYGEVFIIDWGIAEPIDQKTPLPEPEIERPGDLTRPGKIVGTVSFMAPERVQGVSSSIQTEIYALGALLYSLLALRPPFKRQSLEHFKAQYKKERFVEPSQVAPLRDIPQKLSHITRRCLEKDPFNRYKNVYDLLEDLEGYIEGKPDWELIQELDLERSSDWEFQENVLLTKQIAITRSIEFMQWVALMISKESFSGNTRIEADLTLNKDSLGFGFLLAIPEPKERAGLEDGFSIWIGSEKNPGVRINRANTEVAFTPDFALSFDKKVHIVIEKVDHHLSLSIDETPILNYTSQLPLVGSHLGLIYADDEFLIEKIQVYTGSSSLMVNCLSVPDAFFASKDFEKARKEYCRIANSFKGRAEGREALFRAGLSLIEEAKRSEERESLFKKAFSIFEEFNQISGAPLEYLGKSLIEKELGETEEEIKYLEMALRRFPKHPLRPLLIEHIHFRLHESSQFDRNTTYEFMLLALRQLPHLFERRETALLFKNIKAHLEPLPFLTRSKSYNKFLAYAIELAFWLNRPAILFDLLEQDQLEEGLILNALTALYKMNQSKLAERYLQKNPGYSNYFEGKIPLFFDLNLRIETAKEFILNTPNSSLPFQIWAHLLSGELKESKKLFTKLEHQSLKSPFTPYYPLYGCYLAATKGEKAALSHFNTLIDQRSPPLNGLLGYSLRGGHFKTALPYEKELLARHLSLYHKCLGDEKKAREYEELAFDKNLYNL
ncbi:MAG: protein kinase [Simkaniaceae bacterium]